ncbi:MAG: hypothetical protein HY288_16265 [Planctomycetia bacterium]|nr:hypothetical protein [Planctomycetia bacterium]
MQLWHYLIAIFTLAQFVLPVAANEPDATDMITWERIRGKPGGGSDGITLWADGRSEILVQRGGAPMRPNPGWTVTNDTAWSYYRKSSPLSRTDAKKKFTDALAAGIEQLKTFTPKGIIFDPGATVVRVQLNGKLKETVLPEFMNEGEKDDKGSENHRRFLAVKEILGEFETDAFEKQK